MKLVYSHPNSMILGSMSSALNEEGIETEIRNDILGGKSLRTNYLSFVSATHA